MNKDQRRAFQFMPLGSDRMRSALQCLCAVSKAYAVLVDGLLLQPLLPLLPLLLLLLLLLMLLLFLLPQQQLRLVHSYAYSSPHSCVYSSATPMTAVVVSPSGTVG